MRFKIGKSAPGGFGASMAAVYMVMLLSSPALAGQVTVTVTDSKGAPLDGSVVYAIPATGKAPPPEKGKVLVMDQVQKEFIPLIMAAQAGTAVSFPNRDDIRHHVYSLSESKTFELPLYIGTPANPVVFDKPGAVGLGCNIHDWMLAYIYVVETPYFAITGRDGKGKLSDIPPGEYKVMAWHFRMKGDPAAKAELTQVSTGEHETAFKLDLRPDFKKHRAPAISGGGYR